MVRGWRLGWRLAAATGLLLAVAIAAVALLAWRASPVIDGRLELPGLQAPVTVERDARGVPTVRAQSLVDAMQALGALHAQDRRWQLELHRRVAAGRLAEAFGAAAVDQDRFLRVLGLRRAAEAQWGALSPAGREVLQAYARGINGIAAGRQARPPEMLLMGLPHEPWTPVDSLGWALVMAWDLGGNWQSEMMRLRLALKLPGDEDVRQRIDQLLVPYPGESPPAMPDYPAWLRSLKLDAGIAGAAADRWMAAAPPSGLDGTGSNHWVLAGGRTEHGKPLLANDPHLRLTAPALWYLVRIETPTLRLAGVSMPGVPLVVLGQNDRIAWGATNTNPDVQDLYLEAVDPADPGRYRTPDGWAAFERRDEVIRVKGGPDVVQAVRSTRHGPVLSDAGVADDLLRARSGAASSHVLALRWAALEADAASIDAALAINQARSVDDFLRAARGWAAPMQTFVVADRDGRIAMTAAGRVPRRGPEADLRGQVPAPGWDARHDWQGWLPPVERASWIDPPSGWLGSANQRIVGAAQAAELGSDWTHPHRMQRIEQVLAARPRHGLDDLAALQLDQRSLSADELLPWLMRARAEHPLAVAAAAEVARFDGRMRADAAAPLVYWAWVRQLMHGVFEDDLGPLMPRALAARWLRPALVGVLQRDDATWCDDRRTPAAEDCASQVNLALVRALDELQARHGRDVAAWRWGEAHPARAEHRPFSRVPVLARWFELRAPGGGDTDTVNALRVSLQPDAATGEFYLGEHGAAYRALYDLGDPARSRAVVMTGASGLPWSRWYRDGLGPWAGGDYLPLWGGGDVAAVLELVPAP